LRVFCDIFSVAEMELLLASFSIIHSFALRVAADPDLQLWGWFHSRLLESFEFARECPNSPKFTWHFSVYPDLLCVSCLILPLELRYM
jgi:hypothetical protein